MTDKFTGVVIAPNDSEDLGLPTRGLYVGTAGNLQMATVDGQTETFTSLAASFILPVSEQRVLATGTTANSIIGLT